MIEVVRLRPSREIAFERGSQSVAGPARQDHRAPAQTADPPTRELICGSDLTTREEREHYRARVRGARTANPKLTERELKDIVAYLKVNFYKFSQ